MKYFVLHPNGSRYGPADETTLAQWAAEGRVDASTQLEEEATGRRISARDVPSLRFNSIPGERLQDWSQAPGTNYANPYPRYNQAPGGDGSKEVSMAWVFGAIGLLCCPIVFSTVGIVMGYQAKQKGHPGGQAAMIFSICTLVIGIIIGVVLQVLGTSPFSTFMN